uniref:Uncharacterized protein n=1 Tax=Anguilla anguilla TaxID=7936 RepID=A0A0E9RX24_ANGAN
MTGLPPLNQTSRAVQAPPPGEVTATAKQVLRYHKQWYAPPSQLYLENYFH